MDRGGARQHVLCLCVCLKQYIDSFFSVGRLFVTTGVGRCQNSGSVL